MSKLTVLAASLAVVPMLAFAAPVFADSPGQLASGPDLYQVRNVTKNGAYGSSASATCNEVVKYSVKLANSEFGLLTNVTVKASLQNGNMTATATNAANLATSVSGTATVSLDKGTLSYIAGSTKVYDVNGAFIKDAADGVTAGGVNVGNLNGSTREFVQFQAKVNCPEVPVVKDIKVCELATKKVITIKENAFDSAKHSKDLKDCDQAEEVKQIKVCELSTKKLITINEKDFDGGKHSKDLTKCDVTPVTPPVTPEAPKTPVAPVPTPTVLPNTGAGAIAGIFAATSAVGAIAHRVVTRRFTR